MDFGHALAGYSRTTVWIDFNNVALRRYGVFNPDAPWNGTGGDLAGFKARYGVGFGEMKGNLVGERFSPDIVNVCLEAPSYVPGVPDGYRINEVDGYDVRMLSYPAGQPASIYDSLFIKEAERRNGTTTPPPPSDTLEHDRDGLDCINYLIKIGDLKPLSKAVRDALPILREITNAPLPVLFGSGRKARLDVVLDLLEQTSRTLEK